MLALPVSGWGHIPVSPLCSVPKGWGNSHLTLSFLSWLRASFSSFPVANQNHNERTPHTCIIKKKKKTWKNKETNKKCIAASVGKDKEKRETPGDQWWECKLVQPLQKAVYRGPPKIKNRTTICPVIPPLDILSKENESILSVCTPIFSAALVTITKTW